MSLTVSENAKVSIPPLDDGTYLAVCYLLADIGMQYNERFAKKNKQVVIGWEVIGETVEIDGETKPRTFFNTYTASLDVKSKLRSTLKAWRGRDFTLEELKAFDLKNIVGVPCFITVTSNTNAEGKTYSNLAGVAKLPKGTEPPKGVLEPVTYDIDVDDPSAIAVLPDWIQKKITESESYIQRAGEKFQEIDDSDGEMPF